MRFHFKPFKLLVKCKEILKNRGTTNVILFYNFAIDLLYSKIFFENKSIKRRGHISIKWNVKFI
jgi:hypothetical protein